MTISVFYF